MPKAKAAGKFGAWFRTATDERVENAAGGVERLGVSCAHHAVAGDADIHSGGVNFRHSILMRHKFVWRENRARWVTVPFAPRAQLRRHCFSAEMFEQPGVQRHIDLLGRGVTVPTCMTYAQ